MSSEHWSVPEQNHEYATLVCHVDGFDVASKDFPEQLQFRQNDARGSPNAYVF